jgi:hypothetical protein
MDIFMRRDIHVGQIFPEDDGIMHINQSSKQQILQMPCDLDYPDPTPGTTHPILKF